MSTEFVLDILIPEEQLRQFYWRVREDFLSYFDNTEMLQDQASRCNIPECCNLLYLVFGWYFLEITYRVLLLGRTYRTLLC